MRKKFTYSLLPDSSPIYNPIEGYLYYLWGMGTMEENSRLTYWSGYSFYDMMVSTVITYNSSFYKLAKLGDICSAYPMIRLQADNLRYLVAEYLYPDKVLTSIYSKGKELTDIRIDGEKLKASFISDKTEELYPGFRRIYKEYSCYIHPSINHHWGKLAALNELEPENALAVKHSQRTIKRTPAEKDMVFINQCIIDTLLLIAEQRKEILKQYPNKWKEWKEMNKRKQLAQN